MGTTRKIIGRRVRDLLWEAEHDILQKRFTLLLRQSDWERYMGIRMPGKGKRKAETSSRLVRRLIEIGYQTARAEYGQRRKYMGSTDEPVVRLLEDKKGEGDVR